MLTIAAQASAGADLRNETMPDMVRLARHTGARVEVRGNDTIFWAMPDDEIAGLQAAFDRLYPTSSIVSTVLSKPCPRVPR